MLNTIHDIFLMEDAKNDNSFKERENFFTLLFGGIKYDQAQARDIWLSGKKAGFELGLEYSSTHAQTIQLEGNIENENHKLFYKKFLRLCAVHNVAIQWHPHKGMTFTQLHPQAPKHGHRGTIYCQDINGYGVILTSSSQLSSDNIDEVKYRAEFEQAARENKSYYLFNSENQ